MVRPNAIASKTSMILAASILVAATALPAILLGRANAAQLETRAIKLSNSSINASDVTYAVSFKAPTAGNVGGVVVDFCANSPLIGVACTAPTDFDINEVGLAIANVTGLNGGFTLDAASDTNTLILTNGTPLSLGGNVDITFDLGSSGGADGVDNPSVLGTFYGRIITFDTDANAQAYASNQVEPTGGVDWGGVALSTTNNLTVTARVQETLTFCVYTTGANCAGASGSAIDIPNSTTPLSPTSMSTNSSAKFGVASNALSGVKIRMWSADAANHGVLKSGANTITAFGGTTTDDNCTADDLTDTVEQFGMRISSAGAGVTAYMPYNCGANNHGWDADTSGAGADGGNDPSAVGSVYGDAIAATTTATSESQSTMEFAAKSALTTEAGIYQSILNFIATGTY